MLNVMINKLVQIRREPFYRKVAAGRGLRVIWYIIRLLLLLGLSFVLLYPLLYMISMAFRPVEEALDPSVVWIPKQLTMHNLKEALRLMRYPDALFNSVTINIVSSLIQTVMCAVTGYGFARFEFKGKKLLFAVVVFSILLPQQLTILPMGLHFGNFDFFGLNSLFRLFGADAAVSLLDSRLTFYLPALFASGIKAGLFIFIFRQFFRGLPKELEDAAAIDGCGFPGTFVKIIVPNALAVSLTVIILSIVWYWNDVLYGSMFVPNLRTVTLALDGLKTAFNTETQNLDPFKLSSLLQAGALLTIAPVLVMYIVLQRFFVQGIAQSGLVG